MTAPEPLAEAEQVQCDRCCGNGEIVTDWDRYLRGWPGDVGDEAVAECPDCGGEGWISATVEAPTIYVRFSDDGRFIRKWSFEPFEGGRCYLPRYEPTWENPDGPAAA